MVSVYQIHGISVIKWQYVYWFVMFYVDVIYFLTVAEQKLKEVQLQTQQSRAKLSDGFALALQKKDEVSLVQ